MVESGSVRLAAKHHAAALAALENGRVDEARWLATNAVEIATAAFGPDSPDLANVVLTCATVERAASDFPAAQVMADRAAAMVAALVDTDDAELMSL